MAGPLVNGFQGSVNRQPAPAEAGDFWGVNPRAVVIADAGQLVAPAPSGLIVGNFAWVDSFGNVTQHHVVGAQIGLLHREGNAVIVNFLAPATYIVNEGFPITLYSQGDMWAKFASGATPGQVVYADPGTGAPTTSPSTASVVGSVGLTSGTATSLGGVVTLTAAVGYVSVGDTMTDGTNSGVITAQLTGSPGGNGTYNITGPTPADFSASTVSTLSNVLDVTSVNFGSLAVGDDLSPISANIVSQISGTPGGVGLYLIDGVQQTFASGTITVGSIATPWIVNSVAASGELAKISTWG